MSWCCVPAGRGIVLLQREVSERVQLIERAPELVLEMRGPDLQASDPVLGPAQPRLVVKRGPALQSGPQLLRVDVAGDARRERVIGQGPGPAGRVRTSIHVPSRPTSHII